MRRLLEIELVKLRNYRAFWMLIIFYAVAMAMMLFGLEVTINSIFSLEAGPAGDFLRWDVNSFPDNWHYLSYIAGLFTYILMIVVVFLLASEFSYKTLRQNVINGLSRMEFLMGKFILMFVLTLMCTLFVVVAVMILGLISSGFVPLGTMFDKSVFIIGYFVQTFGYCVIAFWVTLLIKRSGIVIGILFIYTWFLENVARALLENYDYDSISQFLPINAMNNLVENPFIAFVDSEVLVRPTIVEFSIAIGYILLFSWLSVMYLKRRDI